MMATQLLIAFANELYEDVDLSNSILIGCQHFLQTNYEMLKALQEKGLKAENMYLIPKSYSYNEQICKRMEQQGIHIHKYPYDSHIAFDTLFDEEIEHFIKKILPLIRNYSNILILDDGGHLHTKMGKYQLKNIRGVEQTSSGYWKLEQKVPYPIVNVARSKIKLTEEPRFIAECFIKNLNSFLQKHNEYPMEALILGGGPIGKAIQNQLSIPSYVFDTNQQKNELFENELKNILPRFKLIIGASGTTSITKKNHNKLANGTILASVSSSDREFDAVHLRKQVSKISNPNSNLKINKIHLLNNGFPLTFDGNIHAVPPEKIQLTQALMLAGIYESFNHTSNEFHDISSAIQNLIWKKFTSLS